MFRLIALQGTDLRGDRDEPIRSVLDQPKRFALLCYLAMTSSAGPQSREVLLGMFWPESEPERARGALNQAVHYLRRSLGRDAVVSVEPEALTLDLARFWCDALAFEEAVRSARYEEALDLYRTDLLTGFRVQDAAGFERWLDTERERMRDLARKAAAALADRDEQDGRLDNAIRWTRRLLELAPTDEAALRRLLSLLERTGERPAALQAYDAFARQLALDYEIEPSEETRRLAEAIRAAGRATDGTGPAPSAPPPAGPGPAPATPLAADAPARDAVLDGTTLDEEPIGVAAAAGASAGGAAAGATGTASHGGGTFWRRRWPLLALLLGLTLAALVGAIRLRSGGSSASTAAETGPTRIAVLPFRDLTAGGEYPYLGEAVSAALADHLSQLEALVVSYGDLADAAPATGDSASAAVPAATGAAADFIVSGEVIVSDSRIRAKVRLMEGDERRIVWTMPIERAHDDVIALVDALSDEVASALRVELGREIRLREWRSGTADPRAWTAFYRGLRHKRDAEALEQAGSIESAMQSFAAADSLFAEAERTDPVWVEPSLLRAQIAKQMGWAALRPPFSDFDARRRYWEEGIRHATRALERNRNCAAAFEARGMLHYFVWQVSPVQDSAAARAARAAVEDLERAVHLDDRRSVAWNALSALHFAQAEYARADIAARRAYDTDVFLESTDEVLSRLVFTSLELGQDREAERWCAELQHRFPRHWTGAYCALKILAWTAERGRDSPAEVRQALALPRIEPEFRRFIEPQLQLLAAAAFARLGFPDSAHAYIRAAGDSGAPADPELLNLEAVARLALDQRDAAASLLVRYLEGNPGGRLGVARSRVFRRLRDHPAFVAHVTAR